MRPAPAALPARVLRARLRSAAAAGAEAPSWAAYLPQNVRQGCVPRPAAGLDGAVLACASGAQVKAPRWWVGRVWQSACDPQGCRDLQVVLEQASEEDRSLILAEMQGHVWEASRCPNANFVLAACIRVAEPAQSQFIVDELVARGSAPVGQTARNKFGCRVIQRLLEVLPGQRVQRLIEGLLASAVPTCMHPYGNYVMQHVLTYGSPHQRLRLLKALQQRVDEIGKDAYSGAVVGKALQLAAPAERTALARALVAVPGLLATLAQTRHGRAAAKLVVQVLEEAKAA